MPSQSSGQRGTVERVMHEFKEGELKQARGKAPKVSNRKQAIAVALHESGSTNRESPAKNKANLARTKGKERRGETAEAETEGRKAQGRTIAKGESRSPGGSRSASRGRSNGSGTKADLYAQAKKRNISGRSTMSKAELQHALAH